METLISNIIQSVNILNTEINKYESENKQIKWYKALNYQVLMNRIQNINEESEYDSILCQDPEFINFINNNSNMIINNIIDENEDNEYIHELILNELMKTENEDEFDKIKIDTINNTEFDIVDLYSSSSTFKTFIDNHHLQEFNDMIEMRNNIWMNYNETIRKEEDEIYEMRRKIVAVISTIYLRIPRNDKFDKIKNIVFGDEYDINTEYPLYLFQNYNMFDYDKFQLIEVLDKLDNCCHQGYKSVKKLLRKIQKNEITF